MRTYTRPDLPPRLHSLLAKLAPVGDPEHAAYKNIIPHGLDDRLNRHARLPRSGRHADQSATQCIVRMIAAQHFAHVADNNFLIAMELLEPIPAFHFKKRFATTIPLAGPLGGEPKRPHEPSSPLTKSVVADSI